MRRGIWIVGVLAAGMLPLGWAGWMISDRFESRNAFCVSCHLDTETPLHEMKMADFESDPPRHLAAAHRAADPEFRCISCHGGTGLAGRLRVKLVAARDAANYLLGRFEEPERMRHPLFDEDCARCHPGYSPARDDAFHAFEDHNVDFPHACVECHDSHHATGPATLHFVERERILPLCRNCHEEF